MPGNVCQHCNSSDIEEDPARGNKVCTKCGHILEEQLIVSEIQFQESAAGGASVMGQFVPLEGGQSFSRLGGPFRFGLNRDPEEVAMLKAKSMIKDIASQLHVSATDEDAAYSLYKLAVVKSLTRGKKMVHVVAACVYIVCRKQKLPLNMLLDFSDILQVNVYILGRTYVHIATGLRVVSQIDPCLYIRRFAQRLDFSDKTDDVCATANRLVQRMTRDWMHTGRRPSGLCGAALLVAARMHDFNRSVKEIIKVVRVCESTVRKRLTEFGDTPSSQLTIEEFHNIDLEEEQDPPCFTEGKKRSKLQQLEEQDPRMTIHLTSEVEHLQQEIEKSLVPKKPVGIWAAYAKMAEESPNSTTASNDVAAVANFIEEETMKDVISESERESLGLAAVEVTEPEVEKSATEETPQKRGQEEKEQCMRHLMPTAASLGITDVVEDCIAGSENEEDDQNDELVLDGIDDDELDQLLLTEDEVKIKTELWMKDNADFVKAEAEKEARRLKEEQEHGPKTEKKKKKYKKREKNYSEAATAIEAVAKVIQEKKLSRKINYDVLEDLRVRSQQTIQPTEVVIETSTSRSSSSILKSTSSSNRSKRSSLLSNSEEQSPRKKKKVQIQETVLERGEEVIELAADMAPKTVVVETDPVCLEDQETVYEEDIEEDEEDEEEQNISSQQMFGRNEIDEEVYDDDDDCF